MAEPEQSDGSSGFVVGRFYTPTLRKTGTEPNSPRVPMPGEAVITLTPRHQIFIPGDSTTPAATVIREPKTFDVDEEGRLIDEDGTPGTYMYSGQYLVEVTFINAPDMPPFTVSVRSHHTPQDPLDLSLQAPLDVEPPIIEVVRTEDRILAVRAAQEAQASASSASSSASTATSARNAASSSQTAAKASQDAAKASQDAAKASQDAAAGSATAAASSASTASTQRSQAQTARTGAETARDAAVAARTGSETARTGAEAAQTGAKASADRLDTFLNDNLVTPERAGLMPAPDKVKLNTLAPASPQEVALRAAIGDGVVDDTAALQAAIDATPAGSTIFFPSGPKFNLGRSAPLSISKPMRMVGGRFITSNNRAIRISANNVTVEGTEIEGLGHGHEWSARTPLIHAEGTLANPIRGLTIANNYLHDFADHGIMARYVRNFDIKRNIIERYAYAGIMVLTGNTGWVEKNTCQDVFQMAAVGNSYGIAISDSENTVEGRSVDVVVAKNMIRNIPEWEGLDTHGGKRISFIDNNVIGCRNGIVLTIGNSTRVTAHEECVVQGNVIDGGGVEGARGISMGGADAPKVFPNSAIVTDNSMSNVVTPIAIPTNRPLDMSRTVMRNNRADGVLITDPRVPRVDTSVGARTIVDSRTVAFDTGWREIKDYGLTATNLSADSSVRIKRTLNELHLDINVQWLSGASSNWLNNSLPLGWRPTAMQIIDATQGTPGHLTRLVFSHTGVLYFLDTFRYEGAVFGKTPPTSGSLSRVSIILPAPADLPTSLIGTEVA